ncbi:ribonuclease H2 subunit B-like isoform X2 [Babylonia areolata]|uniref:ribonuclease H2 subunit B-like isoform X2 n=1 Tax=Babylonia areolata TaxID=304850 RepID=UPI003FD46F2A
MPRSSRQASKSSTKPARQHNPQSQWIMITEEKVFENDSNEENTLSFSKLRHPKSEQGTIYLISGGTKTVYEVVRFSPQFSSWLIGETVHRDGSMLITTPVDPVFLVLPYLITAGKNGKFMTLDQMVLDADFPDISCLLHCDGLQGLDVVADQRGADDIRAYRYNKEKTLAWLAMKTENVAEALRRKEVSVGESGAHSANFIRSKNDQLDGEEAYLKYAYGVVSDYLPLDLAASLKQHLGIKETKENIKPEAKGDEPPSKKARLSKEDVAPIEDYSSSNSVLLKKDSSKGKQTAAQKRLNKVDKTGMKSISSFFSPKS